MSDGTTMLAEPRERIGKGGARATRRAGRVPGVIYGDNKQPTAISIEAHGLEHEIASPGFLTTLLEIKVNGETHRVLPREVQLHPVTDVPLHIDFQRVSATTRLTIVSPDVGGVLRARAIAKRLDAELAIIDKRRESAGVSQVMHVIGDVDGRRCILVDDIVDSAGTLCNAAEALVESGASTVSAYVTHGVLSGGAVARVTASPMEFLIITDSIQATEAVRQANNIRQLTIAPLLSEAIRRIAESRSVSSLFD